ncbi:MAG TPA: hypothetical protein VJI52_06385 [Candidatus Nanoarchaeia archaeon]|nr:hypothetical protein [Candidatus Nanoarchaeia archaeon]
MTKALTVEQLVNREGLNIDPVYEIVREKGMDPKSLYKVDVDFILRSLRTESPTEPKPAFYSAKLPDRVALPDRVVLKFHQQGSDTELYVMATSEKPLAELRVRDSPTYSIDDVLQVLGGVAVVPARTVVISRPSGDEPRPRDTSKPRTPRKKIEAQIHERLFEYVRDNKLDLVNLLYAEPLDDSQSYVHNTRGLSRIIQPDLLAKIKESGCEVDAMTLQGFMSLVVKKREARVRKEVQEYLAGGSTFLHRFDHRKLQIIEEVPDAIKWIVEHRDDPSRDIAFYATALSYLLRDQVLEKKVKHRLAYVANTYEQARLHPLSERLPEKFTVDDFVKTAVQEFLKDRKSYQPSTIVRLYQGFFVMGRFTDARFTDDLMSSVPSANYLICNFGDVDKIVKAAYRRIKEGTAGEGTKRQYRELYSQVSAGSFKLNGQNIDILKRAINANLTDAEIAQLESMRSQKIPIVSHSYRDQIIRSYLMAKGKELVRG